MTTYDLNALIVRVTADGENVFTGAFGESVTGVPATPEMHYRNGAFAFTYIAHIVSQMVDEGIVSYDDTLSTWLPDLPSADAITLRNLLNMTSGYADYVYQPELLDGTGLDPFRQWTSEEMIEIGTSVPLYFEPGTNWGYSHTNYVILGRVLEQIAGKPMAEIMQEYIVEPMGLTNTSSNENTPLIPEPVLHSFSSERREVDADPLVRPVLRGDDVLEPIVDDCRRGRADNGHLRHDEIDGDRWRWRTAVTGDARGHGRQEPRRVRQP